MNEIFSRYLQSNPALPGYFAHPLKPDWNALSEEVMGLRRTFLTSELIRQNEEVQFERQKQHLAFLKQENTLLVVSGQQLGFLVSPLYVVFKALTAVALSARLNEDNRAFNYVPVFWLEGEDHDFDEVNHAYVFDRQNELKKIEVEASGERRTPVGRRSLPRNINEVLSTLKASLQPSEFSGALFDLLASIYRPGENWLRCFKEHLQELLGPFGLLFFDPGAREVKEQSLPFFKRVLSENDALLQALRVQTAQIGRPQVPIQLERAYLFFRDRQDARQPILREGKNFRVYGEQHTLTLTQLLDRLSESPDRISASVLTRPLWQSWMLPVVSYVAGPAEIAYWAQLKEAFKQFDISMPHLQPRFSATLIEPRIDRLLKKFDLRAEDVPQEAGSWIKAFFKQNDLKEMEKETARLKAQIAQSLELYRKLGKNIDPTLESVVEKTFSGIENNLQKMNDRLLRAFRQKNQKTVEQLTAIHHSFYPAGKPQERVLSSVYFHNKFGLRWLKTIFDSIDLDDHSHKYVAL
ncbi:bacillithiol biosynthesis cysteine-adding enzyme BshC [Caldithrix abyssi]